MALLRARTFDAEQWFPRPIGEVFAFFEDPRNLDAITPPWLSFRTLPPVPARMRKGALLVHILRIRHVPVLWGTLITEYEAPHRFVDRQLWGPYLKWRHVHTFASERGGTRVRDHVEYLHAGGPLVDKMFVRPDIERIFAYRAKALEARFSAAETQGL